MIWKTRITGSGSIEKHEFIRAMRVLRVDLTSRVLEAVFAKFDHRRNGSIDYNVCMYVCMYICKPNLPYLISA